MSNNERENESTRERESESGEVNIFDYWHVIWKRRKSICIIVGVVTVLSIIISLILPKVYKADTVIISMGGGSSLGAIAAIQAGSLPFLGDLGGIGGQITPVQKLMAILRSRTLAENIIKKFDLMKVFFKESWDEKNNRWKDPKKAPNMELAVSSLKGRVMFSYDIKEAVIKLSAMFEDPRLAAAVANGYIEDLQDLINRNSFTMAKRNRIFIEEQLEVNKKDLLQIGKQINEFYKDGKVSDVESRVNVMLDVSGEYDFRRGDQSADYIKGPEDVWNRLENVKGKLQGEIENTKIAEGVPQQVYLQYIVLRRELLGKMNALLTQQYEMAKIEEAKEDLAFQIIDSARVPEYRYKPRRKQIVILAFISSFFCAVFLAFILEHVKRAKKV